MKGISDDEAALDALERAKNPSTLAERERCPTCGNWLADRGGKWRACPTCSKLFEPDYHYKAGDYVPGGKDQLGGTTPF